MKNLDQPQNPEQIPNPKFRLMITRHAERLPSGELSEAGQEHAKKKGKSLANAEVLKGYASDHKSKRAFETGDLLSRESGVVSKASEKQYRTKEVSDIQYDILKPDLYHLIGEAKDAIEVATLNDLGWSTERDEKGKLKIDIEKLDKAKQAEIAPVRQKYQKLAFKYVLEKPEAVRRMAMGLASQLLHESKILQRYVQRRTSALNEPKKDVILNTNTHGLFMESLFRETGIMVTAEGKESGVTDFESEEFGGYIQPAESIYLDIENPAEIGERIPVVFEGENRPKAGRVFIDVAKLRTLNEEYEKWKEKAEKEK